MDMYQKRKMRQEKKNNDNQESFSKVSISWYPGHMAKTKRLIKENINLIDIIYEVIDSRIPYSSKIKDIDESIGNKPKILIMTKYDLCDLEETNKFIKDYENKGYNVIPVDLVNNKNIDKIIIKTKEILKPLDDKRKEKGLKKRSHRALIIGIPNVGKSTLINRLVGKKAAKTGNMPGITKNLNWIKLDNEEIALNLCAMSAIKEEILNLSDISIHILKKLDTYYKDKLIERYKINKVNYNDIVLTLDEIGKNRGCITKGNQIDYDKVYSIILKDIKEEKIKGITFDRFNN